MLTIYSETISIRGQSVRLSWSDKTLIATYPKPFKNRPALERELYGRGWKFSPTAPGNNGNGMYVSQITCTPQTVNERESHKTLKGAWEKLGFSAPGNAPPPGALAALADKFQVSRQYLQQVWACQRPLSKTLKDNLSDYELTASPPQAPECPV